MSNPLLLINDDILWPLADVNTEKGLTQRSLYVLARNIQICSTEKCLCPISIESEKQEEKPIGVHFKEVSF